MRIFWPAVSFVVAAIVSAGPSHAQTLRFGLANDPDALDPTLSRLVTGRSVLTAMCDKLFDLGPDAKIVPQLATGWAISDDQKALTIKLRSDVRFHDGEKLDASAVKFSLERHLTMPGSQRHSEIAPIESVEVIDDLTVLVKLKMPFAPLLSQLTDRAGMIVSPRAARALGDKFATAPVCAGPYRFVERVPQDRIVLERFDDYWNKGAIQIERIEFRPIVDATVRVTNLRAGQLDIIERLSPNDVAQIERDSRLKVGSTTDVAFGVIDLIFNVSKSTPLAMDPRIREAFDLSIDREALNKVVWNGMYTPGNQWSSPKSSEYVNEYPIQKRDVAKAKRLLAAAGVKDPVINLVVFSDSEAQQVVQVIQSMTAEAGFDVRIRVTDSATTIDLADRGEIEAMYYSWSGRVDPDGDTYNFLACKAPLNYSRYCNADVDAALNDARATSNFVARQAAWKRLADRVMADRPVIYLAHRKLLWGYTSRLSGFENYPDGLVRFTDLKLN